jgi:catalase
VPPKRTAAKKAVAKKTVAKKAAVKKAAARNSGAQKATARKAPARSTSGPTVQGPAKKVAAGAKGGPISSTRKRSTQPADPRPAHVAPLWAQRGDRLTSAQGVLIDDTDNSLKAGARGPSLMEDFHLREKITHFDHERIPERVVHARGAGAHGTFRVTRSLADVTRAGFLAEAGSEVPVFVRFSTVAGSRGSADTVRDVRGFAVKFYTPEGNVDLVGNNIPVFFIQDGIKFPDIVHAVKPEPDREMPQAQSAHDTFWDFVSLQPETTHMLMWVMSDRAIPRSYRTMEGFGVHTFRLVNAAGRTSLVKFHWKPVAGKHSLVWEEAHKLCGIDPDFHRRDLWDAIEAGAFPQWDLGVQVMPDNEEQTFEGIDLLDPTKLVPEELAPVRIVGRLTLDRNPSNFFAETEQIAFHPGHLVPGIEITDDPLIQARVFSYLDTQLTRLGGPNFSQIPINRPHAPVNDNLRDGFMQQAIPEGKAAYAPNSVGGGCPFTAIEAGDPEGAYVFTPRQVDGPKVRERAQSFDDHYSQATLFWNSMSAVEREHLIGAFSFELSMCFAPEIVQRMVGNLANIDPELCAGVAAHLGLTPPQGAVTEGVGASAALSLLPDAAGSIEGRTVGVLAAGPIDGTGLETVMSRLTGAGAVVFVVGPNGAPIAAGRGGRTVDPTKTFLTADSVVFDAIVVAGAPSIDPLLAIPKAQLMVQEAYRHHKTIASWGTGREALTAYGIPLDADGVVVADRASATFARAIATAIGWHRHWDRPELG